MLDKDQKPLAKLMIEESYGHVLRRALALIVFRGLEEIRGSMRITGLSKPSPQMLAKVYGEQIQTERVKEMLKFSIDKAMVDKDFIIEEILRQYGLVLVKEEQEFYHRVMENILVDCAEIIKRLISVGNYGRIGQFLPMPKSE